MFNSLQHILEWISIAELFDYYIVYYISYATNIVLWNIKNPLLVGVPTIWQAHLKKNVCKQHFHRIAYLVNEQLRVMINTARKTNENPVKGQLKTGYKRKKERDRESETQYASY